MDEGTRARGAAVDQHKRGPEEIRAEIAQTRDELGETVEALAAKTDVKSQAKAKVEDTKEQLRTKVYAVKERVGSAADGAAVHTMSPPQQITTAVAGNPVPMAMIGVFLAGLLVGVMIGRRRR